ncbi:MAG: hypothetical protein ACREXR_07315 [Gammaproteobacteria bacterium]
MVQKYLCLLLISLVLVGCAFGRKQDYLQAHPVLELTQEAPLAVGVQDRRPYILDHDKDEDFVGLQRGGYGNPFDVGTQSKQALAEDMAKVLTVALGRSGAMVTPVKLSPSLSKAEAIGALQSTNAEKSLLLLLYEWKSDTYNGTEIIYELEMEAIDKQGKVLARKRAQGIDQLGAAFWDPQGHAQEAVPAAFQRKLEDLFLGEIADVLNRSDSD